MARTKKHSTRKHKSKKGGSVTNTPSLIVGPESKDVISNYIGVNLAQLTTGDIDVLKGGNPKKGQKSKTMKGKKDFTTKKSSKVFNRRGHYQNHAQGSKKHRRPFRKHKVGGFVAEYPMTQTSLKTGDEVFLG